MSVAGELLIDTSTLIDFFEDTISDESDKLMATSELVISVITFGELYKFLLKTGKNAMWPAYKEKLSKYKILEVTKEISEKAAAYSHMLGLSFGDSLIYASARLNNLTLITSDAKHFKGKRGIIISKRK